MFYLCRPILPILLFFHIFANAQSTSSKKEYRDFVLLNKDTVYLLTTVGELLLASSSTPSISTIISTNTSVDVFALDRQGNLIVSDKRNQIRRLDRKTQQWTNLPTFLGKLHGFAFDSQNNNYLITNRGIINTRARTIYFPDSSKFLNTQSLNKEAWHSQAIFLVDKHDKIWLGFDYGEWGGDVFCFDTQQQTYLPLSIESGTINGNPVSGFCETQDHIYLSSGLVHFFTHGRIFKFSQGMARPFLQAVDHETPVGFTQIIDPKTGKKKKVTVTSWQGGEYIGPIAYNSANNCLYFYSQNGIFKGDLTKNLSNIKAWQRVFKPTLQWTGGRSNAVGPAMNVLKMQFDSQGTLFFLTEHDGLGVYDGKQLRFIK